MVSCASHDSNLSTEAHQKVVNLAKNSPLLKKRTKHSSQKGSGLTSLTTHGSPAIQPKFSFGKGKSKMQSSASAGMGAKTSVESIPQVVSHHGGSKLSLDAPSPELVKPPDEALRWSKDDLFVADLIMRTVTVHHGYFSPTAKEECTPSLKVSEPVESGDRTCLSVQSTSQPHKLVRSKDSCSSVSSSESCRDGRSREREMDGDVMEGIRKEEERTVDPAGSLDDVDSRVSVGVAGVSRGDSIPPSPVPSHQSTSSGGVAFRERRKRGNMLH